MRKKREKMNFYDKNFSKLMKACFFFVTYELLPIQASF